MTALPVTDAAYPTPDEIRDTLLRAIRFEYARLGIDRNVLPGSDDYVRIEKLAGRIGIAIANNEISQQDADPLTATGAALARLAGVFGVYPRPAAGSSGAATITATTSVTLPSNWTGTAPNGRKYVATPGTYANGAAVTITSISGSTGRSTVQTSGTIITWDSAAIGALSPTAIVTAAGLTGGVDADDDDTLRARLLQRLSAAAGGGNWSEVVEWAEDASASVEAAYCYAAAQGAASFDVAVTAAGGDRTVAASTLSTIAAYIAARMPGQQQATVTTVTPEYVDVVLVADLPLPQLAGGAGGGWRDAAPWPAEDIQVASYAPPYAGFTATTAPTVGTSIGVWDPTYTDPADATVVGIMREYTISEVFFAFGSYFIAVQGGFSADPTGAYISAGAVSLVDYARTFADAVAVLGPGEKTSLPELLPRAARQPAADVRAPAALTDRVKSQVIDAYGEILDLTYSKRVATGTATPLTTPSVPATSADPPNVLVLKHFAIRAA